MKNSAPEAERRATYPSSRITLIAAVTVLTTACASPSAKHLLAQREPAILACPVGSIRTCEVTGGNKFSKRYGRCVCWRR
jgi:hypothetical protein